MDNYETVDQLCAAMAILQGRIKTLEEANKAAQILNDAVKVKGNVPFEENTIKIIKARTYADLMKINPEPPAFGFVSTTVVEKFFTELTGEHNYDVEFKTELMEVPAARYFIYTYPPPPRFDFIDFKSRTHDTVERSTVIGIYQPSAGALGSIVHIDKDIDLVHSNFAVGVDLGDNYKVTGMDTYTGDDGHEKLRSMAVSYKGFPPDKLCWLELMNFGPEGNKKEANRINAKKLLEDKKTLVDQVGYSIATDDLGEDA
jgi:hypothetical protein